jgi:hypothetical protein
MKSKLAPKTPFQNFNEAFFSNTTATIGVGLESGNITRDSINWYDKKGVIQLPDRKVAEILIDAPHVCGDYTCYIVKIVNKDAGEITRSTFHFKTYLKKRFDLRPDYKSDGFKIVEHCGINWYIAIPDDKEIRNMANAIFHYIAEYV